ncbi:GIY-YIG nuclease family protein [Thiorhodovibrio frisius]|uniref:Putative endonuclease containing a URI domain n=1 Tax=Thiorhodovibrio frisius TaxID=631362 RepID=H8Z8D3_9GAMM|nr:endonuclease containing a URI domain [Thiorhodovibrio frisius]EIC19338.1 putative endonuclease containing a URI domain [Thiorhodovibrio frisius]WPL22363.1 GIY-YIG nuclease superfamily protein [Thiorhodovibrio frisius]
MSEGWYVYIAECTDNSYFAGVTQNITDVREGSDYLRHRTVKSVPWCRLVESKSAAILIQTHIRALRRELKEYVIYSELECDRVLNLSKKSA